MATRLEGVWIPVELDTSKAQKQLDQLDSSIDKDKKKADNLGKVLDKNGAKPSGGKNTGTTGVSGGRDFKSTAMDLLKSQVINQGSTPVSGTLGKLGGLASKVDATGALAEGAVGAAALYGAVRTVALNAPLALETGRAAFNLSTNDPVLKAVQDQLGNLMNSVNYLESYVKSAVTGIGKTYDMATAMARVNGKVPNLFTTYGIYKEADMQEDMLNKRFEFFKNQEVAGAVGASLAELFKGGINQ